MAGIYLHIPFCKQACHYCNFHFSTNAKRMSEMVSALIKEMKMRNDFFSEEEEISTIYFGGGTPSVLKEEHFEQLMNAVHNYFSIGVSPEVTIEANPDDLDIEKLGALKRVGVNRLSIGIQSFHDRELKMMNRVHNAEMASGSVHNAQDIGIDNISIDLIFGVQESTEESWLANLEQAIKLNVPHMSCYNLTIEPRTALAHFVKSGKMKPVDDELSALQFGLTMEVLERAGFEHYEISNYAQSGMISNHNSNYWRGISYLGIGPSAHSYKDNYRNWNIANNALYLKSIEQGNLPITEELLTPQNQFNELVLTRLRTKWGVDFDQLKNIQPAIDLEWNRKVKSFESKGWLTLQSNQMYLTQEGKYFADYISSELFR